MVQQSINIAVTGAAGQIGYSLLPRLLDGTIFGPGVLVNLHLLDIEVAHAALAGVALELEDLRSPQLGTTMVTENAEEAFKDCDYVVMLGAFPRKAGMERKDLLSKNAGIFAEQGKVLARVGKSTARIIVVGNPANTNAAILAKYASPHIPRENITALTRLDHNRLHAQIAMRAGVNVNDVKRCCIWGNHSSTQFPDPSRAIIQGKPIADVLGKPEDVEWMRGEMMECVQKRGAAIIAARKLSSAMSAAKAIYDHLHDLEHGNEDWVSMAVPSDGSYGVPEGLVYSFPIKCTGQGNYEIVKDLEIDAFGAKNMKVTQDELVQELNDALSTITA
mmetsp:Transcript_24484/g.72072  ORF Transcript_24484/g.72072 Transcript_24484/m.72072 type:complete len:333 (+) Transcript_24484:71-1069(+)